MNNIEKLIESLPVINFIDNAKPHHFIDEKGNLNIDGEYGDCLIDYYGEVNNGYPYIHPELLAWAKNNKGYFEWVNPGAIVFLRG